MLCISIEHAHVGTNKNKHTFDMHTHQMSTLYSLNCQQNLASWHNSGSLFTDQKSGALLTGPKVEEDDLWLEGDTSMNPWSILEIWLVGNWMGNLLSIKSKLPRACMNVKHCLKKSMCVKIKTRACKNVGHFRSLLLEALKISWWSTILRNSSQISSKKYLGHCSWTDTT